MATPFPQKQQYGRHILMVTISALGHLIPLLELAKKVAPYHHITFAVSASRVPSLKENGLTVGLDELGITLLAIELGMRHANSRTVEEFLTFGRPGFIKFLTDIFDGKHSRNINEITAYN